MTLIKICGIQKPADALTAAQAGADFVGLVFVPHRRRCLKVEDAEVIVSALRTSTQDSPKIVGLFADQPLEEVNRLVDICNLDVAQLCGQESLDYCSTVKVPVIKVVHIREAQPVSNVNAIVERIQQKGHLVALDRKVAGLQGGTGRSFNWNIAAEASHKGLEFVLAGGLTPNNVVEALELVRPWGVDVSSGVETNQTKDPIKIQAFIDAVRSFTSSRHSDQVSFIRAPK